MKLSRPIPTAAARTRGLTKEPAAPGMKLGTQVRHGKFGDGVVLLARRLGEPTVEPSAIVRCLVPVWMAVVMSSLLCLLSADA